MKLENNRLNAYYITLHIISYQEISPKQRRISTSKPKLHHSKAMAIGVIKYEFLIETKKNTSVICKR